MTVDLERLCWMVLLVMTLEVELSVWRVVAGYGWIIYSGAWQRGTVAYEFSNKAPIYASAADAITFHNIFQRERISILLSRVWLVVLLSI